MSLSVSNWQALMTGDGPDQEQRFPAALAPGYFNVDELGFEQLLALSAELAAVLRFHDMENRANGNWAELFMGDEAVIMALMLSKDLDRTELDYLRHRGLDVAEQVLALFNLAAEINRWQQRLSLSGHESGLALSAKIATMIGERLADNLHDVGSVVEQLGTQHAALAAVDFGQFSALWSLTKLEQGYCFTRARQFSMDDETKLEMVLRTAFYSFLNGLSQLKVMAATALAESLKNQRHEPAMGLFLAFLQLFRRLQNRVNSFTQRHLDFYYRDVLRATPRERAPDCTHLLFTTEAGSSGILIPKGTAFSAGKDQALQEVVYLTDNDLTITDARVTAINTLYLERDCLISPERELGYVTRIKAHTLPSMATNQPVAWPIFGATPRGVAAAATADAKLGFAIASPMLLLKEGRRKIVLTILLDDPVDLDVSLATFRNHLDDNATVLDSSDLTEKLFCHIFSRFLALQQPPVDRAARLHLADKARGLIATLPMAQLREIAKGDLPAQRGMIHKLYLLARLQQAESETEFLQHFGPLFSRYLLCQQAWLDQNHKQSILLRASTLLSAGAYEHVKDLLQQERGNLFYKLVKQIFNISLTSASGWHAVKDYAVVPAFSLVDEIDNGLQIELTLASEVDAIIPYDAQLHDGQWQTLLPMMQLHINPQANFYPYSLFDGFLLKELAITVDVEGIRDILAYNNHGQIDARKPFNPFGPIATSSSYFAFGNYELAKKQIQYLKVHVEWAGLPQGKGGFSEHYSGYDQPYDNDTFVVDVGTLQAGKWWPAEGEMRYRLGLFDSESMSYKVSNTKSLDIHVLNYSRPITATLSEEEFALYAKSRNGLYRLMLAGATDPFGHGCYTTLLTRVLSQNARLKKPGPIPNPPYVPLVNQISLDYRASSVINVGAMPTTTTADMAEKIFHIHPFGIESINAVMIEAGQPFLPPHHDDGNLYIGLAAAKMGGLITLFFDIAEDSAQTIASQRPEIGWFYLASNRWWRLAQAQVVSDTTNGFLSSGIVTLDIPVGIDCENTVMPGGRYWLRASSSGDLNSFCSLRSVQTQALRVQRRDNHDSQDMVLKRWQPMASITGLGKISQIGGILKGRQYETPRQLKTRISERLRHKHRATTAWDYEHLVMEHFPDVFKIKCFNHMNSSDEKVRPGHLLVVVVPYLNSSAHEGCSAPLMNAVELDRVGAFIRQLASPFAVIEVRNPVYERIQIRCTVKFSNPQQSGLSSSRLDRDISNYICPWKKIGYQAKFGWTVRREDVEAYVRSLDYVDFVTNFSMLHITQERDDRFTLGDTAHSLQDQEPDGDAEWSPLLGVDNDDRITPRYPWSLAVPTRHHFIETINSIRDIDAEPTGIGELEIGTTFIINGIHSRG